MSVHMYNNHYQHCDVYGIGATSGSSVFMESNYFDAVKRPIMSSLCRVLMPRAMVLSLVRKVV